MPAAMKLRPEQLAQHLARELRPVYLISGDEPLLAMEAADAIRARARRDGFDERIQVFPERSVASWDEAVAATQTLSLFATRRILEIRMPTAKPGHGAATLQRVIAAAGDDLLLMIHTGKLDRAAQDAPWVSAVQERGAWIPIQAPDPAQLPGWLAERLRSVGLAASEGAVRLLATANEGNLMAAAQEIEKLLLRFGAGARLDEASLADALGDSARYSVFQLNEAIAARDAARALRMLAGLRAEGTEALVVLWWLARALHSQAGAARPAAMARYVARAVRADRMAKGRAFGEPWDEMALLTAELCGRRTLPLPRTSAAQR
jgi:DNA polymerase-3 subunit delta